MLVRQQLRTLQDLVLPRPARRISAEGHLTQLAALRAAVDGQVVSLVRHPRL